MHKILSLFILLMKFFPFFLQLYNASGKISFIQADLGIVCIDILDISLDRFVVNEPVNDETNIQFPIPIPTVVVELFVYRDRILDQKTWHCLRAKTIGLALLKEKNL